jgi:TRAP-type transport system periplasmic protein
MSTTAWSQTKWDLASAYPPANFHTENLNAFAADVDKATGVVESMMSSGSTGWDAKLHEHVKHFYDTQAWLPKNAVIVNKAAFDALDAATKQAVLKAADDAQVRGWAASQKANGETLDKLKGGGMQILPPSVALKTDMKKVGETMLKEWLDKAGAEGKQLVDAFQK